jgi:hypothetical protein
VVKPLIKSASRRLWPSSWWLLRRKVRIVVPGLIAVKGRFPSPCRCLSPGLQKAAKA